MHNPWRIARVWVAMQAELEKRGTAVAEADTARQALATELQDARAELAVSRGCAAEAERDRDRAREQHADAQKQVADARHMAAHLERPCGFEGNRVYGALATQAC